MTARKLMFAFILFVFSSSSLWAATYQVDPDHTTVEFKIRHLFSWVKGTFNQFEGQVIYDPENPESWSTSATIQVASIDTRVQQRDDHLRSADFFDVEKYPTMTFVSTHVTDVEANRGKLHGNLTLHGVTKPVTFDLTIHGVGQDPWGNVRAGFTAVTTINRIDYGLNWNQVLEAGNLLVGEEVEITLEVEGLRQE